MTFHSILFRKPNNITKQETVEEPDFFPDLNLDQVINSITGGRQEYNLKPFFYAPLRDADDIAYRHEVMQDLENGNLLEKIQSFASKMTVVRRYLALVKKLDFNYHKKGWFLEAAEAYCEAVTELAHNLELADLKSRGFSAFREYVRSHIQSGRFTSLLVEAKKVKADLSTVKYCIIIKEGAVKVRRYEQETDYSVEVEKIFEKFKRGAVKDYRIQTYKGTGMNHIEAQILDFVAKLYPDIFASLDRFCERHSDFPDETISVFDREIQFYASYLLYISRLKQAGLKFCYPQISMDDKEIYDYEGFDLALAYKLVAESSPIVRNDFYLKGRERIFVVTGPNQGGKTTFARAFGQMHYLASIGCPVPGREAKLFLFDNLFTHFEKEEDIKNLRGKLQDDLIRIHAILQKSTSDSVIIMNEIFTSTSLKDAVLLAKNIMEKVIQLDALCVCVTFMDELASMSEKTVSMVSSIVLENPAQRTYKITRKPADGLSYAISIAEKHRVTYSQIKERIHS
ncbi:MAG: DNA mismatch repair protein MutS [Chloroflexi bacterium]|nr:DNA mismatch repair protein MutS [Chloroflexota bacterium]